MNKNIFALNLALSFALSLAVNTTGSAATDVGNLKPSAIQDIVTNLQDVVWTYQGRQVLSGYGSTESCLYTSDQAVLLEHYCWPKRKFPAKSVTILSREWGVSQLYQETFEGKTERIFRARGFSGELNNILNKNPQKINFAQINKALELLSGLKTPVCWSANRPAPDDVGCLNFSESFTHEAVRPWWSETQNIVQDEKKWEALFNYLKKSELILGEYTNGVTECDLALHKVLAPDYQLMFSAKIAASREFPNGAKVSGGWQSVVDAMNEKQMVELVSPHALAESKVVVGDTVEKYSAKIYFAKNQVSDVFFARYPENSEPNWQSCGMYLPKKY